MVKLTFIEPSGDTRDVEATVGNSVMQAATAAGVLGIAAECGGACMCATCHCLIVAAPEGSRPDMGDTERDVLEFTSDHMHDNSRLACQIPVTPELAGGVFKVIGS